MNACRLCPRECGALRLEKSGDGYCRMGTMPSVARAALHYWEEPCISGTKGSGTVFFTGCSLQCVFCQNEQISLRREVGKYLTPKQLSEVFFHLVDQGAHNINLVSACHFAPAVAEALSYRKLPVPVVYNSSGYESIETLHMLEGLIDIYLPDYKYDDPVLSKELSNAENYVTSARQAILEMVRQTGPCEIDHEGLMQRGTIVRHLILPGHTKNSIAALDWMKENLPKGVLVSLMAQYLPCGKAKEMPPIDRRITEREYQKVQSHLFQLGLEGFVQDRASARKKFIPSFCLEGLESFK